MRGRNLQEYIRRQITRRLGSRSWTWLADEAGVPRTTLVSQMSRSKLSVEVLVGVSEALNTDIRELLPPPPDGLGPSSPRSIDAIARISEYLQVLERELEDA
ncbi:MAG: helix-turn-helix domain-containing protein [Gemmatimonadota bacterium]|nr:helix-turn-helix domain-containing protein [Gemmatimonadota bacterium]